MDEKGWHFKLLIPKAKAVTLLTHMFSSMDSCVATGRAEHRVKPGRQDTTQHKPAIWRWWKRGQTGASGWAA